jgi:3-phenylpropionate/trans-cinnamate dioxygenase ferredoxin subunit
MTSDVREFVKVGTKNDFPEAASVAVQVNGRDICIIRHKDRFYAFDNRCSHAESQLSGGDVEDGEIVCPLHGARFNLATGEPTTLPAVKPVRTYEVKVEGDNVFLKI